MGNTEAKYFERRLGLNNELHFEFNEKKKFNCLSRPIEYCLSDAKGRKSAVDKKSALKEESKILRRVSLMKLKYNLN